MQKDNNYLLLTRAPEKKDFKCLIKITTIKM